MHRPAHQESDVRSEIEDSLMPLLLVLARRIRLLIVVPLLAALLAYTYSELTEPMFVATARILPPQYNEYTVSAMSNRFGGESLVGNSSLTLKNPTDLVVGILLSRTITDAVIDRLDLRAHYLESSGYEARRKLQTNTDILAGKDGIVSIAVADTCAEKAADIANAYVEEFYVLSSELAHQEARRRADFFERAMQRAREQLRLADVELSNVERSTGFTRLEGQDEAIVQAAAEIQAEISAREVQLRTMSSYATPANPDLRLIAEELENLRGELERLRTGQAPGDAAPFLELGRVPEVLMAHTQRERDVRYWESVVELLGKFTELGKIDEQRDMSLFQILDRAVPPEFKSTPRTGVNMILATLGTGMLCIIWVLAEAHIANRRSNNDEFERQWQELMGALRSACNLFGAHRP